MIRIFGCLLIIIIHSGCMGTNTGNPGATTPANTINTAATGLISAVCARVAICFAGASELACSAQVLTTNGYTTELGPNTNTYSTMSSLDAAEQALVIQPNAANLVTCKSAIAQVSCSGALMLQSYSSGTPTIYSSTNKLFQSNSICQQVY